MVPRLCALRKYLFSAFIGRNRWRGSTMGQPLPGRNEDVTTYGASATSHKATPEKQGGCSEVRRSRYRLRSFVTGLPTGTRIPTAYLNWCQDMFNLSLVKRATKPGPRSPNLSMTRCLQQKVVCRHSPAPDASSEANSHPWFGEIRFRSCLACPLGGRN